MAQNINVVVVSGNLTRDPELRHTPAGTAVATLRIAVNDREKINGEWQDRASYFDVTVWGNQAESCVQYLSKGRPINVHGRLRWREWQAQDGSKRSTVEIVAQQVQFLNARGDGGGRSDEYAPSEQYASGGDEPAATGGEDFGFPAAADDDIPF